ncbi:surface lipoprotein assembly modifier [Neisseria gonorrhoeae]
MVIFYFCGKTFMPARNRWMLLLPLLASAAYAEETPREPDLRSRPEFRLHEAEVKPIDREKVPGQVREKGKVLQIDGETLLKNPELLSRAMYSAVVSNNIAGIRVILPIYLQQAQQDKMLALYAQGILAQADGRVKEAISHYRELIAAQPDAPAVRMRLAAALFEDRQNEAAADQFDRLKAENLPPQLMEQVELYRKALRERDAWKVNGGFSVTREHNINQAPKRQQYGKWTFPKQVDGTAVNYRLGAEKKWSLKNGWYTTAGGDVSGRVYPGNKKFNDMTAGVSGGIGFADRRKDAGLAVFHERRTYGNDAYSYTNGARLYFNRWQTPRWQTLSSAEWGRLKNTRRARSDNTHLQISNSLVFYRNARQYWTGGLDFYRERNPADRGDNFNRYGLRFAWGQEWGGSGLSSLFRLGVAKRHYEKPGFFSSFKGERRRDKESDTSLSLWHRALHFKGITPRLTLSHRETWSNDVFNEYEKNRAFVEFNKTF